MSFHTYFAWNVPWAPEVSRGPLRDLPAEGRRVTIETLTETENRARQTSGTQGTWNGEEI